jgi:molybdopterin-containing oxidoreductase family iron-sulfur binding subunit
MRPVFNTKQTGDVLLSVAQYLGITTLTPGNNGATYHDYLRNTWGGGDAWRDALRRGGNYPALGATTAAAISGQAPPAATPQAEAPAAAPVPAPPAPTAPALVAPVPGAPGGGAAIAQFAGAADARFHLVVYPSYRFFDGRTANRPWLLELPDPVTKVSWDSWVEIHPATAEELGVRQGEFLEIRSPHATLRIPAYVYPGVRRDVVAIQQGLGHTAFGRYTENRGVNPNLLLGPSLDATGAMAPYSLRVSVRGTGDRSSKLYEQGSRVQLEREIAQAVSLTNLRAYDAQGPGTIPGQNAHVETLRGHGGFQPVERPTDPAAYPPAGTEYGQYVEGKTRWAMVIDTDRCIGCSACVTACYAENNIPVVGPDQVRKGREMSWLRIERYFGVSREREEALQDDATSDVRFLPMLCQQCGNAPCEPVCPVYAAYHTPDGLNGQVYNRCVGTRYCANNCPYKVRYFNWFTYQFAAPLHWQLNPDVTVREKGVMEKCTFCVQRINEGQRNAALEGRPLNDGEVTPACVQTCPTEVFVFGNIADPNSAVARAARSNRSYRVLEAQNTQPGVVYLQKVTLREPKKGHHADEMYGKRGEAGREHGGAAGTGSTGSQLEPHRAPAGAGSH